MGYFAFAQMLTLPGFQIEMFDLLQETPRNELHKSFFVRYLYSFHGPGSQIPLMVDDVKKD